MIEIGKTLISEDVVKKEFVCNISKCNGICCVKGDMGAPVDVDEIETLNEIYDEVAPYLTGEGRQAIETQGTSIVDDWNEISTPLVEAGGACAYVVYDENKTIKCGIEQAYLDGKISYRKPISCHLYPVRLSSILDLTAVNYDVWDICSDACTFGKELKVPVYKFLKEPLIRKFGEEWYSELEKTVEAES